MCHFPGERLNFHLLSSSPNTAFMSTTSRKRQRSIEACPVAGWDGDTIAVTPRRRIANNLSMEPISSTGTQIHIKEGSTIRRSLRYNSMPFIESIWLFSLEQKLTTSIDNRICSQDKTPGDSLLRNFLKSPTLRGSVSRSLFDVDWKARLPNSKTYQLRIRGLGERLSS